MRAWRTDLVVFLSALAFALFVAAPARAGDSTAPAAPRAGDKRVIVVLAGDKDHLLESVVTERVREAGASVEVHSAPSIDPAAAFRPRGEVEALARVWIDFTRDDQATLLLLDDRFDRGLIRHTSRARGDELAREELGHILYSAVRALLAGARIGIAREDLIDSQKPPEPSPPDHTEPDHTEPPSREPSRTWRFRSAVTYAADTFAPRAAITHGPGLALDLLYAPAPGAELGLRALGQVRFPVEVDESPFVVRLESFPCRLLGTIGVPLAGTWSVSGALGGGVDVVHVVPVRGQGPDHRIAAPTVAVFSVARVALGLSRGGDLRVGLWLSADVDLNGADYTYVDGGATSTLFSPYRVRPGLTLEVGTP